MGRLTLYGMLQYEPTLFDECNLPAGYDKEALIDEILTNSGDLYPFHQQPLMLKRSMRLWFARNYLNFDRIMEAITAEYNPIENYDRYEDSTRTPDLYDDTEMGGADILLKEAGQKSTTTVTGSDTMQRSYSNYTEKEEIKGQESIHDYPSTSGSDYNKKTGNVVNEHVVSAFDSSTYEPSTKDTETYNDVKEEINHDVKTDKTFTNRENDKTINGTYSDIHTHDNDKTEVAGSGTDTDTTTYGRTEKISHTGTEEYTAHIHGNIGVTTNQQMILSEIELRKYDVYTDIAQRFEKEFLMQLY